MVRWSPIIGAVSDLAESKPDVRVQQFQSRRTSHSFSSLAGETISPTISKDCFIDPIHDERSSTEVGGTTSATGFPNRVTRIGFFVERTRSSTARHLALNSEMAISCMASLWWSFYHTMVNSLDHSKNAHCGLRRWTAEGGCPSVRVSC